MPDQFDAIIIGADQPGSVLAARLAGAGRRVALVGPGQPGAGDASTPIQALAASARRAWSARQAARFGVVLDGPVTVDMEAVKARKDAIVAAATAALADRLARFPSLAFVRGEAHFLSPTEVKVGRRRLSAPQIFINTGTSASVPPWPGIKSVPYLTSSSMMNLDSMPDHLIIVGAGHVGLEFAHIYTRLGAKVTVISRGPRALSAEDADISAAIRTMLEAEGVTFMFGTTLEAVARAGHGVLLSLRSGKRLASIEGSHLLVATGRRPDTDALNLAAAGLEADDTGFIPVDDHLRTAVPGIWALGGVTGRGAGIQTSCSDCEMVADNLLDGGQRSIAGRIPVCGLFIDPPLGRIGMTEARLRQSGRKALIATMPMTEAPRARDRGETQGLMKILVDAASRRILGAAILGIGGDEVVQSLLPAMAAGTPYTALMATTHIHPTVTSHLPTLLARLKPLR